MCLTVIPSHAARAEEQKKKVVVLDAGLASQLGSALLRLVAGREETVGGERGVHSASMHQHWTHFCYP